MRKLPRHVPEGTLVDCNVRGRLFTATVEERIKGGLRVSPPRGITWRVIKTSQVVKLHTWDPLSAIKSRG